MAYTYRSVYLDDEIVPQRVYDIMLPKEVRHDVCLFWVHGGGWVGGHREGAHAIFGELLRRGFVCATTDYRLRGVTAAEQLTDIRHAYANFRSFLAQNDLPQKICTYGCSAGAHLCALLSFARPGAAGDGPREGADPLADDWKFPAGAALQSTPVYFTPWRDIFPHIWTSMQAIAGVKYADSPATYEKLSPIAHVDRDACPVFFMEAGNEHMFPVEQVMDFVEKMKTLGRRAEIKTYPRVEHGFFYELTRPQQQEALEDLTAFMLSL